jgi:hypothetical protein
MYLHEIVSFIVSGLREGFAHINAALGLIIAAVFAYGLNDFRKKIWAAALGATLLHLFALVMLPVLANNASFRLPSNLLESSYWRVAVALYFGYLVVITVFYFIKKQFLGSGKPAKAH